MTKPDLGHQMTDKELAALEKRIAAVYKQARDDMQDQVTAYFESFAKRDEEMKSLIGTAVNGREWTEQDYKQWRLAQLGRGERFEALRDKLAERMTKANEVAVSYVNDATPGIYSLNRNYAAYTIEQVAGAAGFTLWDEQTVKRLIVEQPDLMSYYPEKKAVKPGIDLAYGKKQITSTVTSGILQGKSIEGLADDLQTRIPTMNRDSAVRTARTAVTGAQNAGRIDSYTAAQKMGIKLEKQWLATLDGRTRHSHAMLDGEHVENDAKFSNGCRFPGDPQGDPSEVYNCRCTLIAYLPDVDTSDAQRRAIDPETGESVLIQDMSYEEWAGWKESLQKDTPNAIIEERKPTIYRQFNTGDEVNGFFYFDGDERGLIQKEKGQYNQWVKSLTPDERDAILDYTVIGYEDINDYFRHRGSWGEINAEKVQNVSQHLDSAISRYKLKDDITVQRGVMEDVLDDLILQYGEDSANFIGKVFHDDGYVSTTALRGNSVATIKPVIFEIDVPAGIGRGAYVNELSVFTDAEYEFLLRRGADYTITDVIEENNTGKIIIKMVMNDA